MLNREHIKDRVEFSFTAHGKQLIHLADIALFRGIALLHIENKRLEQIHLRVVPEVVAPPAAGVLDDDVAKELRHQLLPADLRKTVP